jgi:hypothetical protein
MNSSTGVQMHIHVRYTKTNQNSYSRRVQCGLVELTSIQHPLCMAVDDLGYCRCPYLWSGVGAASSATAMRWSHAATARRR